MGDSLRCRIPAVLLVAFSLATSTSSAEDCGFRVPPTGPDSAKMLLGMHAESVVDQLQSTGVAFAPANTRMGCDGYSHALVYFSQSRQRVLELLSQTARQSEFLSHEIISRHREVYKSIDEHRMRVLFTRVLYQVRNTWNPNQWTISWSLDPEYDNSLRMLRGYWYLHSYKEGTLGVYGSKVDVGPIVPMPIQSALTNNKLRRVVMHFRYWVDSDGNYRP